MSRISHNIAEKSRGGGGVLLLAGLCAWLSWACPAHALVVQFDIGWGYSDGWTSDAAAEAGLRDTYHLQEGSIVQIIMFNYPDYPSQDFADGPASENFEIFSTLVDDSTAEPYGGLDPETYPVHVPEDKTVYDPYSVPEGHVIAYQTQIGDSVNTGPNGTYWYNIFDEFTIYGTWDQLYIRVFGATDFPNGEVVASYWGLSTVQTNPFASPGVWIVPVGSLDDVVAVYTNYFEVVPEPGSLALMVAGGAGLLGWRWRRRSARPR